MALFVPLDVNWPNNEKVIAVGLDGAGLHAMAMCLAKSMETDGVVSRVLLHRVGATDDLIDRLVFYRLFDPVGDHRVHVHGWLERNPSREEYTEDGKRGAHKRWHKGPFEGCLKCNPAPDGPDSPPIDPIEGYPDADLSTDDRPETPEPGDNPAVEGMSSSMATDGPPIAPHVAPHRGGEWPPNAKSESETDSETETDSSLAAPRSARGMPPTIAAAFDLLTARAMLANPTQNGNADRHRGAVLAGITRDLAPTAYLILSKEPGIEPQALADRLRPPAGSPPALAIAHPNAPEPGRRYDIATEADTAARLAEQRAFEPPDRDAVKAAAAKARHAIAHPDAPAPEEPDGP